MTVYRDQFALNPLQWINLTDDGDLRAPDLWRFRDPSFRFEYQGVLAQVKAAGFDRVMMEVLDTQTLQSYAQMLREEGLDTSPGYVQIALPEESGSRIRRGDAGWVRWFDRVRRRAEETVFFGMDRVFLASDMDRDSGKPRVETAAAVGAAFDQDRLERVVDLLGAAAEVLQAEGVAAALHNHVGSWVETDEEMRFILDSLDPSLLGIGLDVGHLLWAGGDPVRLLSDYRGRVLDLHIKDIDLGLARDSRQSPCGYYETAEGGLFRELGLGDVDLVGIIATLDESFSGTLLVEVDTPTMEPSDSARTSWNWVESNYPARIAR